MVVRQPAGQSTDRGKKRLGLIHSHTTTRPDFACYHDDQQRCLEADDELNHRNGSEPERKIERARLHINITMGRTAVQLW